MILTGRTNLRAQLEELFDRIRTAKYRRSDLAVQSDVRLDGEPEWIRGMLNSREIHDEDYVIFSKFENHCGTILDIGANWGYSVGSIRAAGCNLPIVSFEIIQGYKHCLAALKRELGVDYDYVMSGLGSQVGQVDLYIPVLNSRALTALATASREQFNRYMLQNMVDYADRYLAGDLEFRVQVLLTTEKIDMLDSILQEQKLSVPVDAIAAIKIDVEGLEGEVLKGGYETLVKNKPLLIVEGAARHPSVREEIDRHGYRIASRQNDSLFIQDGDTGTTNGIFVHPSKFPVYRSWGLLADN